MENTILNSYKYKYIYDIKSVIVLDYFLLYLIEKYGFNKFFEFSYNYVFNEKENLFTKIYKKDALTLLKEFYNNGD